jgi:hypothetical protein
MIDKARLPYWVAPGLGAKHYLNGALFWQQQAKEFAEHARGYMVELEWKQNQYSWMQARYHQHQGAMAAAKARAYLEALLDER